MLSRSFPAPSPVPARRPVTGARDQSPAEESRARVRASRRLVTLIVGTVLALLPIVGPATPTAQAQPAPDAAATRPAAATTSAAPAAPAAVRPTLVVLGDSLAAGYGVDTAEAYPAVLQRQLDAAGLDYRVVNAGVSGDTSAGAVRRVDWLLRRPVDALLLEIGGNDGLRGQSTGALKTNLVTIIERVRRKNPQARVILAGMKMPPNMGAYARDFEQVFVDVAREQGVALIPFLLEGVGGVTELNQPDGIHPTPEGHRRVATNVWKVLKPVLQPPGPKRSGETPSG